jgi:beta-galactosidase
MNHPITDTFLFGASVYPENQTRDEWLRMLDHFERAAFTAVRLGESAWGHLEPERGRYQFDWVARALDDLHERGLRAILGTSTYIAPLWLLSQHPDALLQLEPGVSVHPMYRKAASLTHPAYREACRELISAYGRAFRGHPAVIGWQLDNEIDAASMLRPDYNPSAEQAWTAWLAHRFGSVEAMNEGLGFRYWGWTAPSFEAVPQPRYTSTEGRSNLPALTYANMRFRRDVIAGFLKEQAGILREAGVTQPLLSNWMTNWATLADDSQAVEPLDYAGLNVYPVGPDREAYWRSHMWFHDVARSAHGRGGYLVTETRIGVTGTTFLLDPFPSRAEFRMWMLQMAAFGASGLIYWSGSRWHGGHWPHWGSLMGWTGEPEPDFDWVVELGSEFAQWGSALLENPVAARAAVLTDFDQRAALQAVEHTPSSRTLLAEAFEMFHRIGVGVDGIQASRAAQADALKAYDIVVLAAAPTLDSPAVVSALEAFVRAGGTLLVLPLVAYQQRDGAFRRDGLGAPLNDLTGSRVISVRRFGTGRDPDAENRFVQWTGDDGAGSRSPLGVDGLCELIETREAEPLAALLHEDSVLQGQTVASRRPLGRGIVLRVGFWPDDGSLLELLSRHLGGGQVLAPLPPGVRAVPRRDGSLFVINGLRAPVTVEIDGRYEDRLTGRSLGPHLALDPFDVVWLARDQDEDAAPQV